MGSRGPVPKSSDQRRRRNSPSVEKVAAGRGGVEPPAASEGWHPVAVQWFEALKQSGQAVFYEPSDWALAVVVAESISRELNPQPLVVGRGSDAEVVMVSMPPKGASLAAWLKAMTSLLVSEGDRRRMRLELEAAAESDPHEEAAVADLAAFRARTSAAEA